MDMITLVGFLAGGLTTASFVPQVVKTARTRSARDLSEAMLLVFLAGLCLWTFYGMELGSAPIIAANIITICLVGAILVMKVKFRDREKECPPDKETRGDDLP